ncbi:MAG: 50S ribosomal protein L13 [Patescibacteria group bacterium]
MQKTLVLKKKDIKKDWHVMDASSEVLGRFATRVATLLIGKHKPSFSANLDMGDKVVIINAEKINVTGRKMVNKKYYKHSGYPGGFKEETLANLLATKPEDVIKKAVWGMLPVNKMRKHRMLDLYVYKGSLHPHKAQIEKK